MVLYEQSPASEFFFRCRGANAQWLFAAQSRALLAASAVANRWTRRPSKGEPLKVHAEERCRCIGTKRIDRCVRIRPIEHVLRIVGRRDGYAVDVAFHVREMPGRELGQHLLADVRHVQLDDREAKYRRDGLWTGSWACGYDKVAKGNQDERVLTAKSGSSIERQPGVEVSKFLLELRSPFVEWWLPLRCLECVDIRIPSPESQLTAVAVDD